MSEFKTLASYSDTEKMTIILCSQKQASYIPARLQQSTGHLTALRSQVGEDCSGAWLHTQWNLHHQGHTHPPGWCSHQLPGRHAGRVAAMGSRRCQGQHWLCHSGCPEGCCRQSWTWTHCTSRTIKTFIMHLLTCIHFFHWAILMIIILQLV